MRILFLLLIAMPCALAQQPDAISVRERRAIKLDPPAQDLELRLTLAYLEGSGWTEEAIVAAARESTPILEQCGVAMKEVEVLKFSAPTRFHDFLTPASRELAATLRLPKPTIYFVAGTRQRPAFDAEAVGRGNSRTRPELKDTVWVTRGTRDLGIAITHELAHVLMDSGEHTDEPDNLMREETAPRNTRLSAEQCARLRKTGLANGLLRARWK